MRWVLGIFVGGIFDVVLSSLASGIILLVYLQTHHVSQAPPSGEEIRQATQMGSPVYWMTFGVGTIVSVLAGYISAVIARRSELLMGALSAWLGAGISILYLLLGKTPLTTMTIVGLILSLLAGTMGGYLRLLQVNRRAGHQREQASGAFD